MSQMGCKEFYSGTVGIGRSFYKAYIYVSEDNTLASKHSNINYGYNYKLIELMGNKKN